MTTWLWWTLGATLWFSAACLVGLLVGATVRLRDLPETLGPTRGRPASLGTWPPPAAATHDLPTDQVVAAGRRPAT